MSTPMTFPPPVNPDDPGRGPMIAGLTWTFTALAIIAVSLRFYVRRKVTKILGIDDWLMLAALVFQIISQVSVAIALHHGLGKHDASLRRPDQLVAVLKWSWLSIPPGTIVSIIARISIAILLIRLFGVHKWFKWFLIVVTALSSVLQILVIGVILAQAQPIQGVWDIYLPGVKRLDPRIEPYTAYLAQSLSTFTDLTYVLLPVIIIWRLNMSLSRRLGLILLMCGSLFTMVMSALKVAYVQSPDSTNNLEYHASLAILWTGLEQTCVIIMGCIPALGGVIRLPIFKAITSSMASLLEKVRSKGSRLDKANQSSPHHDYYDLERNVHKLTRFQYYPEYKISGPTVTHDSEPDSEPGLVAENRIRQTDRFTVEVSQS